MYAFRFFFVLEDKIRRITWDWDTRLGRSVICYVAESSLDDVINVVVGEALVQLLLR